VISQNAPIRGVTPSYENPQWRFLQGRGELLANSDTGGAFNIFEAAEFPDKDFPLYIYGRLYSKKDIMQSAINIQREILIGKFSCLKNIKRSSSITICKQLPSALKKTPLRVFIAWSDATNRRRDRMVRLCKDYGFDTEDPNFDPAFID
jgi:hypothetical protein